MTKKFQRVAAIYLLGALILPTFQPVFAAAPVKVTDVGLTASGLLMGQVVDNEGKPVANSPVALLDNAKGTKETTTNDQGYFSVDQLSAGMYVATTPGTSKLVRVWAPRTAPPAASKGVLLVQTAATTRAQNDHWRGCHEFLRAHWLKIAIGLGIAGGVVAIVENDDAS